MVTALASASAALAVKVPETPFVLSGHINEFELIAV